MKLSFEHFRRNKNFELRNIAIGLGSLLLVACEIIPESEQRIPVEMGESNRTSLIVEFSGLNCNNCPKAADEAHTLLEYHNGKLVVVEMHPPTNDLTYASKPEWDYTCPEADEYYAAWSISSLPSGVINMVRTNDSYNVAYQEWGTACMNAAKMLSPVTITQQVQQDSTNALQIEATIRNLSYDLLDLKYIAWLTEDSIIGPQRMPNSKINPEYVHNHILRDAITDIWGHPITIDAGDSTIVSLSYNLPEKVVPKNCNVVGVVLQNNEAIQVNEYKLNIIQ